MSATFSSQEVISFDDSDDTESDNSDEYCDLKYKRAKSGNILYSCSYCGQDDIQDPINHFDFTEEQKGHFSYGDCKSVKDEKRWYLMNIAPHY